MHEVGLNVPNRLETAPFFIYIKENCAGFTNIYELLFHRTKIVIQLG